LQNGGDIKPYSSTRLCENSQREPVRLGRPVPTLHDGRSLPFATGRPIQPGASGHERSGSKHAGRTARDSGRTDPRSAVPHGPSRRSRHRGRSAAYRLAKVADTEGAPGSVRGYAHYWSPIHLDVVAPELVAAVARATLAGAVLNRRPTRGPGAGSPCSPTRSATAFAQSSSASRATTRLLPEPGHRSA
jgi:hypothetical protein